jgi:hypothetical protein
MASLTIRPGSRIRLKGQDSHVPDFIVVRCERDQCWVRQQTWHPATQLNVRFTQILIPPIETIETALSQASANRDDVSALERPNNVIYLDHYRQRRSARDLN